MLNLLRLNSQTQDDNKMHILKFFLKSAWTYGRSVFNLFVHCSKVGLLRFVLFKLSLTPIEQKLSEGHHFIRIFLCWHFQLQINFSNLFLPVEFFTTMPFLKLRIFTDQIKPKLQAYLNHTFAHICIGDTEARFIDGLQSKKHKRNCKFSAKIFQQKVILACLPSSLETVLNASPSRIWDQWCPWGAPPCWFPTRGSVASTSGISEASTCWVCSAPSSALPEIATKWASSLPFVLSPLSWPFQSWMPFACPLFISSSCCSEVWKFLEKCSEKGLPTMVTIALGSSAASFSCLAPGFQAFSTVCSFTSCCIDTEITLRGCLSFCWLLLRPPMLPEPCWTM